MCCYLIVSSNLFYPSEVEIELYLDDLLIVHKKFPAELLINKTNYSDIENNIFIPPQTVFVGGYTVFTLSDRVSETFLCP